jgi:D-glycero-D-manno-heptose 1,7-bisphosphate phosphatase
MPFSVKQATVLVGGLGTRLGDLTAKKPKPLLMCGDRPFLGWLLREIVRYGIEEVVLLAGHMAGEVYKELPEITSKLPRKIRILVSEEPNQSGTGGALYHARDCLADQFLLLNGDTLFDGAIGELLSLSLQSDHRIGRVMLRTVPDALRYGTVSMVGDSIIKFVERSRNASQNLINGGVYLFRRSVLDYTVPTCSLERDVLPQLAAQGLLEGRVGQGYFIDIGIPSDFRRAETEVPHHVRRPALFLDRDGVVNVDHGWVGTRERFEWIDGACEAMALASRAGWHVFIVTNQAGVARGFYSEAAIEELHSFIREEVRKLGGTVDDIRYCPHHPNGDIEAYRIQCNCRKPAPGMINSLLRTWELDPSRCILIGDKPTDLEAARRAGVRGIHFRGGDLRTVVQEALDQH